MNLELKIDDPIFEQIPLKYAVYIYLLNNEARDGYADLTDARASFSWIDEEIIDEAVKELEKEGWLEIAAYKISLRDKHGELLRPKNNIGFKPEEAIEEKLQEYEDEAIGLRSKQEAQSAKELYAEMKAEDANEWNVGRFLFYYRTIFSIVFREAHREWQKKEWGQMGSLMKMYKPDLNVLRKMIAYYLINDAEFGLSSVGGLLFKKDEVQTAIRNYGKEKKADLRIRKKDTF